MKKWAISNTELMSLSVLNFSGRIKLIDSRANDFGGDHDKIRDLLGIGSGKRAILGFDTESKPKATYSQSRNRTALVQLASENVCVLWRTVGIDRLPDPIVDILGDPNIVKVGQGVGHDVKDMRADFRNLSTVKCVVDLHTVASKLNCQPKSLQGLVGMFLRKRLLKDMRISNWEAETLRAEQIQYAAIDAWASRSVFLEMESRGIDPSSLGAFINDPEPVVKDPISAERPSVEEIEIKRPSRGSSAQVQLVDLCLKRGYLLRLVGFEKSRTGDSFKCVFEIVCSRDKTLRVESANFHPSIRAAQEDAASVALALSDLAT